MDNRKMGDVGTGRHVGESCVTIAAHYVAAAIIGGDGKKAGYNAGGNRPVAPPDNIARQVAV